NPVTLVSYLTNNTTAVILDYFEEVLEEKIALTVNECQERSDDPNKSNLPGLE
ncbi:hypothetical protein PV328_011669, partial [Microctonus aethiopoides]